MALPATDISLHKSYLWYSWGRAWRPDENTLILRKHRLPQPVHPKGGYPLAHLLAILVQSTWILATWLPIATASSAHGKALFMAPLSAR